MTSLRAEFKLTKVRILAAEPLLSTSCSLTVFFLKGADYYRVDFNSYYLVYLSTASLDLSLAD